jgi:hypothetical protein
VDHRTPAEIEDSERRKAEVLRLRRRMMTFEEIGQRLNPPVSRQRVKQIYDEALADVVAPELTAFRAEHREVLEEVMRQAWDVAAARHVVVSHGKVIYDEATGEPLLDSGPKLAALREVRATSTELRKLFGGDAAVKVDLGGDVSIKYTVVGIDPAEAMR